MTRRRIHVRHRQGMRIIREEHGPCEEEGGQEIILESSSAYHQDVNLSAGQQEQL